MIFEMKTIQDFFKILQLNDILLTTDKYLILLKKSNTFYASMHVLLHNIYTMYVTLQSLRFW